MGLLDGIVGGPLRGLGVEPSEIPGLSILFDNPAEEGLQKAMQRAQKTYEEQRAKSQEQRMQALANILPMLQPYNDLLAQIYGPRYQIPTSTLLKNPMSAGESRGTSSTPAASDRDRLLAGLGFK
jgi:hypothetical protein